MQACPRRPCPRGTLSLASERLGGDDGSPCHAARRGLRAAASLKGLGHVLTQAANQVSRGWAGSPRPGPARYLEQVQLGHEAPRQVEETVASVGEDHRHRYPTTLCTRQAIAAPHRLQARTTPSRPLERTLATEQTEGVGAREDRSAPPPTATPLSPRAPERGGASKLLQLSEVSPPGRWRAAPRSPNPHSQETMPDAVDSPANPGTP